MNFRLRIVVSGIALAALLCGCSGDDSGGTPIRLATWNLQFWGVAKAADPVRLSQAARIIARYDIVAVQEVRDATGTALTALLDEVNAQGKGTWAVVSGDRVGRSSSKQQYAVFYKPDVIDLVEAHQFVPDAEPVADTFEYEPLMLDLREKSTAKHFSLIVIQTDPSDASTELDGLPAVAAHLQARFVTENAVIVGTLYADCSYVDDAAYNALALVSGPTAAEWHWQIGRGTDTTTSSSTSCGYQGLLTRGEPTSLAVQGSAIVRRLANTLGIDETAALSLSDSEPVEILLRF